MDDTRSSTPLLLGDLLRASADRFADRVAVESIAGRSVTYAELADDSRRLAVTLGGAGLRRGDRVATLSLNSVDQVVMLFACAERGLLMAPLSWRSTPTELAALLADAEPELLACDPEHADLAERACALLEHPPPRVLLGEGGVASALPATVEPVVDEAARPDDPVLLLYTSGSSGRAKGVPLSHANCWATNRALAARVPLTAADVVLMVLPQFHVAAWNVQPLLAWQVGGRVIVVPSFDAGAVLDVLERRRVTAMMGVPTTYQLLAGHAGFERADLSSLRTALVGGAPADPVVIEAWAAHDVRLTVGYGLTEAGPNVLCEPPSAGTRGLRPYPGVEVALRDLRSSARVDGPGRGELLVRGGGVFAGYWRDPAGTATVLHEGWLATGDVADRGADGGYALCGRSNEKFISGGENVHPAEVEQALLRHPAVDAAAVVGVPDPTWGEAGVAFVVLGAGRPATPDELRAHLRTLLAGYKIPREVVAVDGLPLTGSGKIDKRALRARTEEQR